MKTDNSIRKKIARQSLRTSVTAISLVFFIAAAGILILRQNTINISEKLGRSAASDSKDALKTQTLQTLETLADNKARLSDETLMRIEDLLNMTAYNMEYIIGHPESYKAGDIPFPTTEDLGTVIPYLQLAEGVDTSDVSEELDLISNIRGVFQSIFFENTELSSVYMGTESGICITVDKIVEPVTATFDPRERPWYKMAKNSAEKHPFWTDVFDDAFGRGLAIACAKSYYSANGEFSGVVGIGFTLESINNIVLGTKIGETGYSFILNEQGHMIMAPTIQKDENGSIVRENMLETDNKTIRPVAEKMVAQEHGVELITIDGQDYYIAYAPIKAVSWSFATLVSVDEAMEMAVKSENNIIKLKDKAVSSIDLWALTLGIIFITELAVIILLTVYLSGRIAKRLTDPIIELTGGAKRIGGGDLEYRFNIQTGDEIQTLSETFTKMIDDIKHITADKERIGAELNVATKIQASMLPCIFPPFPNRDEFDIYASMLPAKEVGGDFYDFFLIDGDHLVVVMADVSGKGVPAALFMVIAKTLIKNNAQSGKTPKETFEAVNNILCENNDADMFVTAFMGYLEISTGKFTYVNAGHNPPVIHKTDGSCELLKTKPGFVLAGMEDMAYAQQTIILNAGDMVYLYTDGVTEAINDKLDLFTEARLLEICNKYSDYGPKELLLSVKREIDIFAGYAEQADDITMLAIKISERGRAG